jgi:Transcription factor WhiB
MTRGVLGSRANFTASEMNGLGDLPFLTYGARPPCASQRSRGYFLMAGDRGTRRDVLRAQAVCATCVFETACYQWAVETRQTWGVWGGHAMSTRPRTH